MNDPAAAAGQFSIYAVENVDQAIALLTGLPAGEADAGGEYPEGSINRRVAARLRLTIPNPDDQTRSRWPVHPLWGYLSSIDWETDGERSRINRSLAMIRRE